MASSPPLGPHRAHCGASVGATEVRRPYPGRVIVLSRFQVPAGDEASFVDRAEAAAAVLRQREGLLSLDFGRNLDEPELWTITTRWVDVGSYRRALSGIESKSVVVPLLSLAVDEPSAYESPELVGENRPRGAPPAR